MPKLPGNWINYAFFILVIGTAITFQFLEILNLTNLSHYSRDKIAPDFLGYWAGYTMLGEGKNPYDAISFSEFIKTLTGGSLSSIYSPPPIFVLLAPILQFDFKISITLWFVLNIGFLFGIAFLTERLIEKNNQSLKTLFAILLFPPVLFCLHYGQLSIFTTFCVYCSLFLFIKNKDFFAGIFLGIAAVKPHLFYLMAFYLVLVAIREKRIGFLGGLFIAPLALAAITHYKYPGIFRDFLNMEGGPFQWMTPTLPTIVRLMLVDQNGAVPSWPGVFIPMISLTCVFIAFIRKRYGDHLKFAMYLLLFSCITSPYLWIFDFSILAYFQVLIFSFILKIGEKNTARFFVSLQLTAILCLIGFAGMTDYLSWWLPFALLALVIQVEYFDGLQSKGLLHSNRR